MGHTNMRYLDTYDTIHEGHTRKANSTTDVNTMLYSEILTLLQRMNKNSSDATECTTDDSGDSTPFVVVLIDGNRSMASLNDYICSGENAYMSQLRDEDVKQGSLGGRSSAYRLNQYLLRYLTQRNVFRKQWRLVVKFYASMSGLGTAYLKEGILSDLATWRQFIDGFNNAFPYSFFLDAGDDDEQVLSKMKAQIASFGDQSVCKHTTLICSAPYVYTGFIRHNTVKDDIYGRITLIEAIPCPGAFQDLVGHFVPAEKESLFHKYRSHKHLYTVALSDKPLPLFLQHKLPVQDQELTPASAPINSNTHASSRKPASFISSHGQVVRGKPLARNQNGMRSIRNACFNSRGQRIDHAVYQNAFQERYLKA